MSSFAKVLDMAARFERPLEDRLQKLQDELVAMIESDRHIILGARATMFYTKPRYTADTDYAVGPKQYAKILRWLGQAGVSFASQGESILCSELRVDIFDATHNAVIQEVLKQQQKGVPSLEAVAALKYVAAISPTRTYERKQQDAADLIALILRPEFDDASFLQHLIGPYADDLGKAEQLLADVKAHRPIVL